MQQYQDAIKNHKAGRPVAFEELPTPPGYAPIPGVAAPDDEPTENFCVTEVTHTTLLIIYCHKLRYVLSEQKR